MSRRSTRCLLLLGFLIAMGGREASGASCAGSCATELQTNPKAVQDYVKHASASLSKCVHSGNPACPTSCPLPDTAGSGLRQACGTLLQCKLGGLPPPAASGAWDPSGGRLARLGVQVQVLFRQLARM